MKQPMMKMIPPKKKKQIKPSGISPNMEKIGEMIASGNKYKGGK